MVGIQDSHRKRLFRAALELAGTTAKAWMEAHQVGSTHFYLVLDGERPSPRLNEAINDFIAETLRQNRDVLALASTDSSFMRSAAESAAACVG